MPPTVSVVIPTYNHRAYILDALDSVFRQTFTDHEVIVVNDGSPDDTRSVLRPLVEANRIRYVEQTNQGQAAARNRGIAAARGEFIALLDDDDLWPEDKLGVHVSLLAARPDVVLTYGSMVSIGNPVAIRSPTGVAPSGDVFNAAVVGNFICSPGQTLIRKAALDALSGFDTNIRGADDWDLWIRLSRMGNFLYDDRLALYYRIHNENSSRNMAAMYRNCLRVVHKHLPGGNATLARQRRKALFSVRTYLTGSTHFIAMQHGKKGEWKKARRAWAQAIYVCPSLLVDQHVLRALARSFIGNYMSSRKRT